MSPSEWAALARDIGVPVAILMMVLWLFLTGKVHSDGEYQEMKAQRDRVVRQLDRTLGVQEATAPVVREAVSKRAEIANIHDLARLVDEARSQGLIE